jgi:hypothetical protein
MSSVHMLWHLRPEDHEEEDVKIIGIYSTLKNAQDAIERFIKEPGFKDFPTGFQITEYELDRDSWVEGFVRRPR